jgi:hypothetical protein
MMLMAASVVILCYMIFIIISKKKIKAQSAIFNIVIAFIYVLSCLTVQTVLIFLIFNKDSQYFNYGITGLYYFAGICLFPVLMLFAFSSIIFKKEKSA